MNLKDNSDVKGFIEDVEQQIQYKPVVPNVSQELLDHIEDRAYDYQLDGASEEESIKNAVKDLGDPSAVGVMLNETHKVQNSWYGFWAVIALVGLGWMRIILAFIDRNPGDGGSYFRIPFRIPSIAILIYGVLTLLIVMRRGYPWIVQHTKEVLHIFTKVFMLLIPLGVFQMFAHTGFLFRMPFDRIEVVLLLLSSVVIPVFAYKMRRKGLNGLLIVLAVCALITFETTVSPWVFDAFNYRVIFIVSIFITLMFMGYKGLFNINPTKAMIVITIGTLAIGTLGIGHIENFKWLGRVFLTPEVEATRWSADAYNSVLIKELLSKSKMIGKINLTQEELDSYYDTTWYLEETFKQPVDVKLDDILPQYHFNNYRLAYWVIHYGWIPAIILTSSIVAVGLFLLVTSLKINNSLGKLIALSGSTVILMQMLLYILCNLGHQLGRPSALPFVSESMATAIANMILAGLILSAYRYDKVITTEDHHTEKYPAPPLQS